MRLLPCVTGTLASLAFVVGVSADPVRLLAPDDPAYRSGWRPPPSPTAALKRYGPVDARNWLELNKAGGDMGPMRSMPSMPGMPGMERGK